MTSTSVAVRQTLAYTARYGTSASSSMSVNVPAFAGIKLFCLLTNKRVQRNLLLSRAMAGDQTQALLIMRSQGRMSDFLSLCHHTTDRHTSHK